MDWLLRPLWRLEIACSVAYRVGTCIVYGMHVYNWASVGRCGSLHIPACTYHGYRTPGVEYCMLLGSEDWPTGSEWRVESCPGSWSFLEQKNSYLGVHFIKWSCGERVMSPSNGNIRPFFFSPLIPTMILASVSFFVLLLIIVAKIRGHNWFGVTHIAGSSPSFFPTTVLALHFYRDNTFLASSTCIELRLPTYCC